MHAHLRVTPPSIKAWLAVLDADLVAVGVVPFTLGDRGSDCSGDGTATVYSCCSDSAAVRAVRACEYEVDAGGMNEAANPNSCCVYVRMWVSCSSASVGSLLVELVHESLASMTSLMLDEGHSEGAMVRGAL